MNCAKKNKKSDIRCQISKEIRIFALKMGQQMWQRTTCIASDHEYSHLINNIKNERKRFRIHVEREGGRHQCQ